MAFEVFLCHKDYSADDLALRLRLALLDHGITAFVDQMGIPTKYQATEKWERFRDNAICNCDTFVMIVTAGFAISPQIIKEIKLATEKAKDIMCFRWFRMKPDLVIDLGDHIYEIKEIQQIEFNSGADLVRQFFDHYERKATAALKRKTTIDVRKQTPPQTSNVKAKESFPKVHFEITQSIGSSQAQRILPDVGFNIRNWSDQCLKARIEVKVLLGEKDLGLIKGSTRGGQYLGYYDGKTAWHLNPYLAIFGHFSLPIECVKSEENLTLVVSATFEDENSKKFQCLPLSWTYVRKTNDWFIEPTGL
jgi:hypothetical protein